MNSYVGFVSLKPKESIMSDSSASLSPVSAEFAAQANINADQYKEMYQRSTDDPDGFWAE